MKPLKYISNHHWTYLFARNLPVWHNTLSLQHEDAGLRWFRLPPLKLLKICREFHTVFFVSAQGRGNLSHFMSVVERRLLEKGYPVMLRRLYYQISGRLLRSARLLARQHKTLNEFFKLYGEANALLDITLVASKVMTNRIVAALPEPEQRTLAVLRFAQPKLLAPIQRLERELAHLAGKKIDVHKEAQRLYRKYRWIPANFVGEPWGLQYFKKRINCAKPLQKHSIPKPTFPISAEVKRDLQLLRLITELNEYRKQVFSQVNLIVRPVCERLAKDTGLSGWQDVCLLTSEEIIRLAQGQLGHAYALIAKRKKTFVLLNDPRYRLIEVYGRSARQADRLLHRTMTKEGHEVTGVSACSGLVRGQVKIIRTPADFGKFKAGDILVAPMTSTDFVPIMRRAAAFVTDEGGLASHAAVIAREYHKPCIVGTTMATQIFRDGDRVVVDANAGVVKKL